MLIGKPPEIPSSAITSKEKYLNRRRFLGGALSSAVVAGVSATAIERAAEVLSPRTSVRADTKLDTIKSPLSTTGEQLTSLEDITHYNNFYEFGVDKGDPARNAGALPTRPWSVKVDGLVKQPKVFDIEALLKLHPLEERVDRRAHV